MKGLAFVPMSVPGAGGAEDANEPQDLLRNDLPIDGAMAIARRV